MTQFATYDPKMVQVIFDGNPITGFADGTFVNIEWDEDAWNKVTGADGLVSRAKTNNYSGAVTVTLLSTSLGNDVLNSVARRDRRNSTGATTLLVKDASGRTVWSAENAWIRQLPAQEFSKEISEREWIIDCANLSGDIGGNQI